MAASGQGGQGGIPDAIQNQLNALGQAIADGNKESKKIGAEVARINAVTEELGRLVVAIQELRTALEEAEKRGNQALVAALSDKLQELVQQANALTQGIDIKALTESVTALKAAKNQVMEAAGAQPAVSGGFRVPRHRHRSVMSHGEGLRAKSAPKAKKTIKRRVKKHAKKSHKRGRK
jgi:polyhydroxyalkanoate synthesis regulator phasin